MLVDSIAAAIPAFFEAVGRADVEIYNEFSLQHELGCFLRSRFPRPLKIQFERPVEFFQPRTTGYEKKEIDISVFSPDRAERVALELKFPRNGQYPEQMFSSCCGLLFLEQLVAGGFAGGLFVMAADDPGFRSGRDLDGIYAYFRRAQPIAGAITKPTGSPKRTINVRGPHTIAWQTVAHGLHYCVVLMAPAG